MTREERLFAVVVFVTALWYFVAAVYAVVAEVGS